MNQGFYVSIQGTNQNLNIPNSMYSFIRWHSERFINSSGIEYFISLCSTPLQFVKIWLPLQEPIEEGERASLVSLPTSSCLQGVWVDDIFNAGTLTTTPIIYKQNDEEEHMGTYNRLSLIKFAIF